MQAEQFRRDEAVIQQYIGEWSWEQSTIAHVVQETYTHEDLHHPRSMGGGFPLQTVVLMPVDSATELPATLRHTLEQYTTQTMSPDDWELLLWLNRPSQSSDQNERELVGVARDFRLNMVIRHFYRQYPRPVTMGLIRAELMDQAFIHPARPILAVCHDADAVDMADTYLEEMTDAALENPDKALFSTELRWGHAEPMSLADKIIEYWQKLLRLSRTADNVIPTSDANTGIRLDRYALTPGFKREIDLYTGSEMRALREGVIRCLGRDAIQYVPDIHLTTSPRRIYAALAAGRPPQEMTEAGEFSIATVLSGSSELTHPDRIRPGTPDPNNIDLPPERVNSIVDAMEESYREGLVRNGVSQEQLSAMKHELGLAD